MESDRICFFLHYFWFSVYLEMSWNSLEKPTIKQKSQNYGEDPQSKVRRFRVPTQSIFKVSSLFYRR